MMLITPSLIILAISVLDAQAIRWDGPGGVTPLGLRAKRQPRIQFCSDVFNDKVNEAIARSTRARQNPYTVYINGNRVELVIATISATQLNNGSPTTPAITAYARGLGRNNDDAGHIVANSLGGTGREQWNIFPQSPNINRGAWAQQEGIVKNIVQRGYQVLYTVVLDYENGGTRPTKIWYRWEYTDNTRNRHCFTGDMVNP